MSRLPDGPKPPEPHGADSQAGTGEGAESALQAMIRKRRQHQGETPEPLPPPESGEPLPPPKP